jgi:hypothetical protein
MEGVLKRIATVLFFLEGKKLRAMPFCTSGRLTGNNAGC